MSADEEFHVVMGQVTENGSPSSPIAGVVVSIFSPGGRSVATVTGDKGEWVLTFPADLFEHREDERIDSGIRYCTVHHGIIEQDQTECDFGDDGDECASQPLVYFNA